jgi:hypothetical protein
VFAIGFLRQGGQPIERRVPHVVCLAIQGVFLQYGVHYIGLYIRELAM